MAVEKHGDDNISGLEFDVAAKVDAEDEVELSVVGDRGAAATISVGVGAATAIPPGVPPNTDATTADACALDTRSELNKEAGDEGWNASDEGNETVGVDVGWSVGVETPLPPLRVRTSELAERGVEVATEANG